MKKRRDEGLIDVQVGYTPTEIGRAVAEAIREARKPVDPRGRRLMQTLQGVPVKRTVRRGRKGT